MSTQPEAVTDNDRAWHQLMVGGAEVDIAVLFADVRGSTALGEQLGPQAFAATLNRFYHAATEALTQHDAIVDKLIGDEVMALFIPGVCGPEYRRHAAEAALALLHAVGYGEPAVDPDWSCGELRTHVRRQRGRSWSGRFHRTGRFGKHRRTPRVGRRGG